MAVFRGVIDMYRCSRPACHAVLSFEEAAHKAVGAPCPQCGHVGWVLEVFQGEANLLEPRLDLPAGPELDGEIEEILYGRQRTRVGPSVPRYSLSRHLAQRAAAEVFGDELPPEVKAMTEPIAICQEIIKYDCQNPNRLP